VQIKNLTTQNQKLRVARDLLLPRLMSGELAV
jgi:type I restriction enzyme S subunit